MTFRGPGAGICRRQLRWSLGATIFHQKLKKTWPFCPGRVLEPTLRRTTPPKPSRVTFLLILHRSGINFLWFVADFTSFFAEFLKWFNWLVLFFYFLFVGIFFYFSLLFHLFFVLPHLFVFKFIFVFLHSVFLILIIALCNCPSFFVLFLFPFMLNPFSKRTQNATENRNFRYPKSTLAPG